MRTMVQRSEATRNMSDGDNATPGLPSSGPNRWLTRSEPPSPGAAPWERNGSSESDDTAKAGPGGNHTDGVTVADLIAKLNGASSVPEELRRPRPVPEARPEPAPQAPPTEVIEPVSIEPTDPDTDVIPVMVGYASEVPDLAALRQHDRVQPSRVGTDRGPKPPESRRRRLSKTAAAGRA